MSLAVGGHACHPLAVATVCQLQHDDTGFVCDNFVQFTDSSFFVCRNAIVRTRHHQPGRSGEKIIENFIAIDLLSEVNRILIALDVDGKVIALQMMDDDVELLCQVDLSGDTYTSGVVTSGMLKYDQGRNIIFMRRNEVFSAHEVLGLDNEIISTQLLFQHSCAFEHHNIPPLCSVWGTEDTVLFTYSVCSSDLTILCLKRSAEDDQSSWALMPSIKTGNDTWEVKSKHETWITAISHATTGSCDLSATGDCSGTIIIWRQEPLAQRAPSAGGTRGDDARPARARTVSLESAVASSVVVDSTAADSSSQPRVRKRTASADRRSRYPVRYLLRSTGVCEGQAITYLLLDPVLNDLWVADVTGAITSAHLSVKSKTLYPTRKLMLFGTVGGPSFLSWQPTVTTEDEPRINAEGRKAARSGAGKLTAFSPACGMLVETNIMSNIEAVFRIAAPPALKVEPQFLGANHIGRVTADEVAVLHAPSVDVCAYFPQWNMLAVTASRSRMIQIWDLYSGLLVYSINTTEAQCKCLAVCDAPLTTPGQNSSTALLAAGYSSGALVVYRLYRRCTTAEMANVEVEAEAVKPATEVKPVNSTKRHSHHSRRASKADSHHSSKRSSRKASKARTLSAHEVDILDAVSAPPARPPDHIGGGNVGVGVRGEGEGDDGSEVSEGSLHQRDREDLWAGSDEDSLGGGEDSAGDRGGRRSSSATRRRSSTMTGASSDYRRGSSAVPAQTGEVSHSVELSTRFCPLPITDILFSTSGGFIAIVHIRKVVVVYNNYPYARKMSLKVSFEEILSDVRLMVPSELTANNDIDRDAASRHPEPGTRRQSGVTEDKGYTFTDRSGQRRASFGATMVGLTDGITAATTANNSNNNASGGPSQPAPTATESEEESLILLLQSATQVRLLDAIRGTILAEFPLHTAGALPACTAAWDVPIGPEVSTAVPSGVSNHTAGGAPSNSAERAITGLCVAQGMRVFLFGEDSGQFRPHFLHDQVSLLTGPIFTTSLHTDTKLSDRHLQLLQAQGAAQQPLHASMQFSQEGPHYDASGVGNRATSLDQLVQGVSIRELNAFSPLACVWSLRRLALLRVQLGQARGAEVLRTEEYCVEQENVRVVYASALMAQPRMRNHRALVVLSNGHVIVMHL